MDRLNAAVARFDAALSALESGCAALTRGPADRAVQTDFSAEIAELRSEREQLLARVAVFEGESQSLAGLAEAVEARLDGAISEIRAALGRG